jgi:hypothetical protein
MTIHPLSGDIFIAAGPVLYIFSINGDLLGAIDTERETALHMTKRYYYYSYYSYERYF